MLQTIPSLFQKKQLEAFLVTYPANITYLTGFTGLSPDEEECIVILSVEKPPALVFPRLYQEEVQQLKKSLSLHPATGRSSLFDEVVVLIKKSSWTRIGFEAEHLSVARHQWLQKKLSGIQLVPESGLIEDVRVIKTEEEIRFLEKAQRITVKTYETIQKTLHAGQTEQEIAFRMQQLLYEYGAEGSSFDPIVAGGPHSAVPHHKTGNRKIASGDIVLLDFGARYKGYCADITRTFMLGNPTDRFLKIQQLVERAYETSLATIQLGKTGKEVYQSAWRVFEKNGVALQFLHGLGHGVGVQIHERPYLKATVVETLKEGMVLTVEPGLYFPGWGGVRYENVVVVEGTGARVVGV
ncbi:aminopeptidase P family protein [Candidatus Roizmanbacteria bacterium]|nr:aminopeptidase P family protein [Candidatus Roizmanbacteria bacterium]